MSKVCLLTLLDACPVCKIVETILWSKPICLLRCFNRTAAITGTHRCRSFCFWPQAALRIVNSVSTLVFKSLYNVSHLKDLSCSTFTNLNDERLWPFLQRVTLLMTYINMLTINKQHFYQSESLTLTISARVALFIEGTRSIVRAVYAGFLYLMHFAIPLYGEFRANLRVLLPFMCVTWKRWSGQQ